MPKNSRKRPAEPSLHSVEENLFGGLFSFHNRSMDLLRQVSLDDEKLNLVADRINTLLADISAEVKQTKDMNVAGRLDSPYDEVARLVDELSGSHDGSKDG